MGIINNLACFGFILLSVYVYDTCNLTPVIDSTVNSLGPTFAEVKKLATESTDKLKNKFMGDKKK